MATILVAGCSGGSLSPTTGGDPATSSPDLGMGNGGGGTTGSGGGTTGGAMPPVYTGSIGAGGGSVSSLYFAVVGDTRPPNPDDTARYPTLIIDKIYSDIA